MELIDEEKQLLKRALRVYEADIKERAKRNEYLFQELYRVRRMIKKLTNPRQPVAGLPLE